MTSASLLIFCTCLISIAVVYGRSIPRPVITNKPQLDPQLATSSLDSFKNESVQNAEANYSKQVFSFPAKQENTVNNQYDTSTSSAKADLNDTEITTVNSTTTSAERFHSNFNLALIPVVVGVVFIIAVCLKCCQWFRQYTRGGSKDNNYYAEIIEDDDDGHLDIVSDTTSTAYYDTVSSYASFLRKGGNDNVEAPAKSLKIFNEITDSPRKWLFAKIGQARMGNQKLDSLSSDTESDVPLSKLKRQRTVTSGTSSSSGEETEVTEIEPLNSSDASILRKQNRFRVSFITENVENSPRDLYDSALTLDGRRPPALKRVQEAPISTPNMVMSSSRPRAVSGVVKPLMVTIGTQTNKTCRKSLRASQLRHLSDASLSQIHQAADTELLVSAQVIRTHSLENKTPTVKHDVHSNTSKVNGCEHLESTNGIGCNSDLNEMARGSSYMSCSDDGKVIGSVTSIGCTSESTEATEADFTDDVFISDTESESVTKQTNEMCETKNNHTHDVTYVTYPIAQRASNVSSMSVSDATLSQSEDKLRRSSGQGENCKLSKERSCMEVKCLGFQCPRNDSLVNKESRYLPSECLNTSHNNRDVRVTSHSNISTNMDEFSVRKTDSCDILKDNIDSSNVFPECSHCGQSFECKSIVLSPRHLCSINSDQRSASLPSLESSGYAEGLSLDGSE